MVDVQMSLCGAPRSVEQALALEPHGKPTEVWLFDDPALTLYGKGLRIRVRGARHGMELTLKAANQDCARLPPARCRPAKASANTTCTATRSQAPCL